MFRARRQREVQAETLEQLGDAPPIIVGDQTFDVVLAGDTSLGDWYLRRAGHSLVERLDDAPMSFFREVAPLVAGKQLLIGNLETVLCENPSSHLAGVKNYLGWDSPKRTVDVLTNLGVDAVSLANNHTMDFGSEVLSTTIQRLDEAGIRYFGAGKDLATASSPQSWTARLSSGAEKRIHLLGALKYSSVLRGYGFYATENAWGTNPLSARAVTAQLRRIRSADPESLVILFPHWGKNYEWASENMQRRSHQFLEAGADLVVGHGAHMMQELYADDNGTVVFSLGNFVFNSKGRYDALQAPPYSSVARLSLTHHDGGWAATMRLYPIVSDNTKTAYTPRPVNGDEVQHLLQLLRDHSPQPESFDKSFRLSRDTLGWHIAARNPLSRRLGVPAAPEAASEMQETIRVPSTTHTERDRAESGPPPQVPPHALSTDLIADELARRGIQTRRLRSGIIVADTPRGRLGYGFGATHTTGHAGVKAARRAALSRSLLADAGLETSMEDSLPDTAVATFLVVGGRCIAVTASGVDLTDDVHPSYATVAARAAAAFPGLDVAEVKIHARNFGLPAGPGNYFVNKVDPQPSIAPYHSPAKGKPRDIAGAIVDMHLGSGRVHARLVDGSGPSTISPDQFALEDEVEFSRFRNLSAQLIARELMRRGIGVRWLNRTFLVADVHGVRLGYWSTSTHATAVVGAIAAKRKEVARELLASAGVEIAKGEVFHVDDRAAAAALADRLGDVVVKPVDGNKGRGVTVGVCEPGQFLHAWNLAARNTHRDILVEQRFAGTEIRCFVIGGRCIAVTKRVPPHVVGNGHETVQELIAAKNQARSRSPHLSRLPIRLDRHRIQQVRSQGYALTDIPPMGKVIVIDLKAGLSSGAESVDLTDQVHPSFADVAARSAAAFPGLDIVGIDIIGRDLTRPAERENYIVCEVNSMPGMGSHQFPMQGTPRDVAGAIVDLHLAQISGTAGNRQ